MDSVTQAALGAAIGDVCLGKKLGNKGMLIGALVATIPDLDVLLLPFYSDIQRISVHRGFSHSILFSVVGALVLTWVFQRTKWGKQISTATWIWCNWLFLITHMLLDGFTSYGTQLFLPFSDYRVSFDSISIVDPAYTVPLLVGLLISWIYSRKGRFSPRFSGIALIVSSLYMCCTLVVKSRVNSLGEASLKEQEIPYEKMMSVPVNAGIFEWYITATTADSLYLAKASDLKNHTARFQAFPINLHLLDPLDAELVERLIWFSQDFYTVAQRDKEVYFYNLQCDMQGPQLSDSILAPTAWHFTITEDENGDHHLSTGMHLKD